MNMKNKIISIIACTLVLGISIIGCGNEKDKSKTGLEKIKETTIEKQMNIIGFNDEIFAIGVGYSGAVNYTEDGGDSWTDGVNKSKCRFGLDIVNDKVAYNCGNGSHVRKTIDGGKNWTEVADFAGSKPDHCKYIRFINEEIGWIASNNLLGVTKDGAKTWEEIKLPEGISKIVAIDLLDENVGYVIDDNNKMYISNDGGANWENKEVKMDNFDNKMEDAPKCAVKFLDDKKGYIYYVTKDYTIVGIYTEDGGETWEEEKLPKIDGGGYIYISRDAKYITITQGAGTSFVLLERN